MIIQSAWQLSFDFFGSKPVVVEPSASQISSDAGLLPFRQLDDLLLHRLSEHIGQHCAADYHGCIGMSRPARQDEYADLFSELERRGYNLAVHRRATPIMHERRRWLAAVA
jgi:hypothetical protein